MSKYTTGEIADKQARFQKLQELILPGVVFYCFKKVRYKEKWQQDFFFCCHLLLLFNIINFSKIDSRCSEYYF